MSPESDDNPRGHGESGSRDAEKGRTRPSPEPVWTYRGYQLHAGEFTTAMVHFFRAEVQRANVWRQRLDTTTNWAVLTTGAAISFAFTTGQGVHSVIIINILLVTLFLFVEARRYRYYELWSYRVRLLETDFFATMLVPPFHPAPDWAESLAENLLHPTFPISLLEAVGRRYRRNYLWIYIILSLAWVLQVGLYPTPVLTWSEFLNRASIGAVPGLFIVILGVTFNSLLFLVGLLTVGLQQATGEVLPRYAFGLPGLLGHVTPQPDRPTGWRAWFRPSRRRQQLIALVVTDCSDCSQRIGDRILHEMNRGATALPGIGMYTGEPHNVLMSALTVTEVNQLKTIVREEDASAFVIVAPVREVLGSGFSPLRDQ